MSSTDSLMRLPSITMTPEYIYPTPSQQRLDALTAEEQTTLNSASPQPKTTAKGSTALVS
ncbi:MAG: hypothetical protein Q9211_003399 [Gyalolechia sp. 1 TL-2023]